MHSVVAQRWIRSLGIIFLILGMLRVPLPQPDYHSLRHHDQCDGEVCSRHNHLLQWHSSSVTSEDEGAVLHWHWVWPSREPVQPDADGSGNPIVHADGDDRWVEPSFQVAPPTVSPVRDRLLTTAGNLILHLSLQMPAIVANERRNPELDLRARIARRDRVASFLQRWDC